MSFVATSSEGKRPKVSVVFRMNLFMLSIALEVWMILCSFVWKVKNAMTFCHARPRIPMHLNTIPRNLAGRNSY